MGVVGLPAQLRRSHRQGFGLVGNEGSWQVVVGGAAGKGVRKADLLVTVETTEEALEAAEVFFQYYRENANYLERSYDFVERLGIEKIRKETVYAAAERYAAALLDRLHRAQGEIIDDAWLEAHQPASQPVCPNSTDGDRIAYELDPHHRRSKTFRRAKAAPCRSARSDCHLQHRRAASSRSRTAARTAAVRWPTASSRGTTVTCPLHTGGSVWRCGGRAAPLRIRRIRGRTLFAIEAPWRRAS